MNWTKVFLTLIFGFGIGFQGSSAWAEGDSAGLSEAVQKPAFKFAWPAPSRIQVTESTLKKGKTARSRYDIVFTRSDQNFELRYENFEFLELNGIDLTNEDNRKQLGAVLAQVTAVQSAIPGLIIGADGNALDVVGTEKTVEAVLKLLPQSDPKQAASVAAMMRSKEMIAMLKEKTKDFWRVWVGMWIDCGLSSGEDLIRELEIPVGSEVLNSKMTLHNEGSAPEAPGCFKLTGKSVLEGDAATKALANVIQTMAAQVTQAPGVKPFSPDMVKDVKRTVSYAVVTDPNTLQPRSAHWDMVVNMTIDGKSGEQVEKHDYIFTWPSSK